MMATVVRRWLIVRADKTMRVTQRKPYLRWDEVAFRLVLTVPDGWGQEVGTVDLEIPGGTVLVKPESFEEPEPAEEPASV